MPPKPPSTEVLYRLAALVESLADSLAASEERHDHRYENVRRILNEIVTGLAVVREHLPDHVPMAPLPDHSQAMPLTVEVRGRWGWEELRPKLWKAAIHLLIGGCLAALTHVHELIRLLSAAAK